MKSPLLNQRESAVTGVLRHYDMLEIRQAVEVKIDSVAEVFGINPDFILRDAIDSVVNAKKQDTLLCKSMNALHDFGVSPNETYYHQREFYEVLNRTFSNRGDILIWGDFDADGVTATTVLYYGLQAYQELFQYSSSRIIAHIPNREDGYGLNVGIVDMLRNSPSIETLICVDNGIRSDEIVNSIKEYNPNIAVVIIDHHQSDANDYPHNADVVINPHQPLCGYPNPNQSAAGIVWRLMLTAPYHVGQLEIGGYQEREQAYMLSILRLSALQAIGTIADVMPLEVAENRLCVLLGLRFLNDVYYRLAQAKHHSISKSSQNNVMDDFAVEVRGLAYLLYAINEKGLRYANLNVDVKLLAEDVGFFIAPTINATGRLFSIDLILSILLLQDRYVVDERAMSNSVITIKKPVIDGILSQAKFVLSINDQRKVLQADYQDRVSLIVANAIAKSYLQDNCINKDGLQMPPNAFVTFLDKRLETSIYLHGEMLGYINVDADETIQSVLTFGRDVAGLLALVVYYPNMPRGVVGLVAGHLSRRFNGIPTVVFTDSERGNISADRQLSASARCNLQGLDLIQLFNGAAQDFADLFLEEDTSTYAYVAGHSAAAVVKVLHTHLPFFARLLLSRISDAIASNSADIDAMAIKSYGSADQLSDTEDAIGCYTLVKNRGSEVVRLVNLAGQNDNRLSYFIVTQRSWSYLNRASLDDSSVALATPNARLLTLLQSVTDTTLPDVLRDVALSYEFCKNEYVLILSVDLCRELPFLTQLSCDLDPLPKPSYVTLFDAGDIVISEMSEGKHHRFSITLGNHQLLLFSWFTTSADYKGGVVQLVNSKNVYGLYPKGILIAYTLSGTIGSRGEYEGKIIDVLPPITAVQ